MAEQTTAWESAKDNLGTAANIAGLHRDVLEMLKTHQRIFSTTFPVRMDSGSVRFFTGYRIHHNHALGPIRGGTRFHPDETLDDMKALSLWMTVKNAINGVPAGGGKGGVICAPEELSVTEMQRLCRAYIRAISPMVGTQVDFPGADVGTDSKTQSWMMDEWEQMHGMTHDPAAISGKEIGIGGSKARASATGYGVMLSVRETCRVKGIDMSEQTVAIQGFGKVGSWAARLLFDQGAKIVAVSDVHGAISNTDGINPHELFDHVEKTGKVPGFTGAASVSNDELLAFNADILIPAALQNVITESNVDDVKAKIIVEGANGPVTPKAAEKLISKNCYVIPDILANGGGTTIAHLERVQCLCDDFWSEDEVNRRYEGMFSKAYNEVYQMSVDENIPMRMAAWVMALRKLESAIIARGWV